MDEEKKILIYFGATVSKEGGDTEDTHNKVVKAR